MHLFLSISVTSNSGQSEYYLLQAGQSYTAYSNLLFAPAWVSTKKPPKTKRVIILGQCENPSSISINKYEKEKKLNLSRRSPRKTAHGYNRVKIQLHCITKNTTNIFLILSILVLSQIHRPQGIQPNKALDDQGLPETLISLLRVSTSSYKIICAPTVI